ncbi:hypothetical protein O181_011389 [Austropuccinia psidii MF-1]|uniref:Uncharacterized protein n=1 Tax=Austropuccinia psidii MF-1 TaxID=1389203 RepID=A0A9Q3BSR7_9BASI|nr:hypothetical protein [Austropuccinia psidii MF-1]
MKEEDSRCQNESTPNQKKLTSRKWGHNLFMPPNTSKVRIQDPFGAEFITQGLPCNFGEARILMVLDPLNGSRPWAIFWSRGIPGSPGNLDPGGPFWPWGPLIAPTAWGLQRTAHGPPTADHGIRSMDRRTQKHQKWLKWPKWPYIQKSNKITQDPKEAKRAIRRRFIKNHHRKGQGPKNYGRHIEAFPRPMGTGPLEDFISRYFQLGLDK